MCRINLAQSVFRIFALKLESRSELIHGESNRWISGPVKTEMQNDRDASGLDFLVLRFDGHCHCMGQRARSNFRCSVSVDQDRQNPSLV